MAQSEAEIPSDDQGLLDVLAGALTLAREEWGGAIELTIKRPEIGEDLPAVDLTMRHEKGFAAEARVFLCNRPTQGGGFKRQLDRVLPAMMGKNCFMLRASDFPPNKKNQTAQAFRKFREGGGRSLLVPIPDWERMMMVREFHAQHRHDPGFADWFQRRQAAVGHPRAGADAAARPVRRRGAADAVEPADAVASARRRAGSSPRRQRQRPQVDAASRKRRSCRSPSCSTRSGDAAGSILAGRGLRSNKSITLNKGVLKRHAAVLGGSGSGKTTLALCIIEQLLLRGTPAVLIDRKGDLCSYANPDVWRAHRGRVQRAARRAREAGRLHRRRRLYAGPRLGAADLDHAAAQRHQRAARSRSSSCWPTSRPPRSATCCTSRTRPRTRSSRARSRWRCASWAAASARR